MIFDLGNRAYSDGPIEPNDNQFKEQKRKSINDPIKNFFNLQEHTYEYVNIVVQTIHIFPLIWVVSNRMFILQLESFLEIGLFLWIYKYNLIGAERLLKRWLLLHAAII